MKLVTYAKKLGISYRTAWQYFNDGKIKNAYKTHAGMIIVDDAEVYQPISRKTIIYSRVSSSENKNNAIAQAERLKKYANQNHYEVIDVAIEVGSGMNDKRKKTRDHLRE